MKFDYINPFLNATVQVFKNMLQVDVDYGDVATQENLISTQQVNISIGVTGGLRGTVLFSFSEELALRIVSEMAGMPMDQLDKFVTSAVGELANIISGQAMTGLTELNYNCDIVPPQVVIGTDIKISMPTEEIIFVPMESNFGAFEIHVSLEKK